MKYEKVEEPVFIVSVELINSRHGYEVIEVKFKGVKTQSHYKTWIDPKFNNWCNWQHILEIANNKGVVLSNIKYKDKEKRTINADSEPRIEYVVTPNELADVLQSYWDSMSTYKRIFGSD